MAAIESPELRRQITTSAEACSDFDAQVREIQADPELPAPDWQHWALWFRVRLAELLNALARAFPAEPGSLTPHVDAVLDQLREHLAGEGNDTFPEEAGR